MCQWARFPDPNHDGPHERVYFAHEPNRPAAAAA